MLPPDSPRVNREEPLIKQIARSKAMNSRHASRDSSPQPPHGHLEYPHPPTDFPRSVSQPPETTTTTLCYDKPNVHYVPCTFYYPNNSAMSLSLPTLSQPVIQNMVVPQPQPQMQNASNLNRVTSMSHSDLRNTMSPGMSPTSSLPTSRASSPIPPSVSRANSPLPYSPFVSPLGSGIMPYYHQEIPMYQQDPTFAILPEVPLVNQPGFVPRYISRPETGEVPYLNELHEQQKYSENRRATSVPREVYQSLESLATPPQTPTPTLMTQYQMPQYYYQYPYTGDLDLSGKVSPLLKESKQFKDMSGRRSPLTKEPVYISSTPSSPNSGHKKVNGSCSPQRPVVFSALENKKPCAVIPPQPNSKLSDSNGKNERESPMHQFTNSPTTNPQSSAQEYTVEWLNNEANQRPIQSPFVTENPLKVPPSAKHPKKNSGGSCPENINKIGLQKNIGTSCTDLPQLNERGKGPLMVETCHICNLLMKGDSGPEVTEDMAKSTYYTYSPCMFGHNVLIHNAGQNKQGVKESNILVPFGKTFADYKLVEKQLLDGRAATGKSCGWSGHAPKAPSAMPVSLRDSITASPLGSTPIETRSRPYSPASDPRGQAFMGSLGASGSGAGQASIDNRIEQAMDLVKSHLMNAVRSEVEELKDKINKLEDTISHLSRENEILRARASPETLQMVTGGGTSQPPDPAKPPVQQH